jgi:hypothetical protein
MSGNYNLSNLSIVHHVSDQPHESVISLKSLKLKRCVNILTKLVLNEIRQENKNYHKVISGEDYYFRYVKENFKFQSYLEHNWWFSYIFNKEPHCATGKLTQKYGTCYLHSIINTIFLTQVLHDYLYQQWLNMTITEKQQVCGNQFNEEHQNCEAIADYCSREYTHIRNELYKVFYNVFIRKEKMKTSDPEIIENVAINVKKKQHLKELVPYITKQAIVDAGEVIEPMQAILYALFKYSNFMQVDKDIEVNGVYDLLYSLNKQSLYEVPFVVVVNEKNIQLPPAKHITIIRSNEEKKFALVAANLHFSSIQKNFEHVVAGLLCDEQFYVYDSNNLMVVYDWTQGDHSLYFQKAEQHYNISNIKLRRWYYAFYVPL